MVSSPLCTEENKEFVTVLHLAKPSLTMPSQRSLTQTLIPHRTIVKHKQILTEMHATNATA